MAALLVSFTSPAAAETDAERENLARALRAMGLPDTMSYELAPKPMGMPLRQHEVEETSASSY